MNAKKAVLVGTAAVVVALSLYPPFVFRNGEQAVPVGYGWIARPPDTLSQDGIGMEINTKVLVMEWLSALIAGGLVYLAVAIKRTHRRPGDSGMPTDFEGGFHIIRTSRGSTSTDKATRSRAEAVDAWPKFADYKQNESGYNAYQNVWIRHHRRAAHASAIPIDALEDHRRAVALAQQKGWRDHE